MNKNDIRLLTCTVIIYIYHIIYMISLASRFLRRVNRSVDWQILEIFLTKITLSVIKFGSLISLIVSGVLLSTHCMSQSRGMLCSHAILSGFWFKVSTYPNRSVDFCIPIHQPLHWYIINFVIYMMWFHCMA